MPNTVEAVPLQVDALGKGAGPELVRLTAPDGKPRGWFKMRYLAWLTVTAICSFFYLVAILSVLSIGCLFTQSYRMHGTHINPHRRSECIRR